MRIDFDDSGFIEFRQESEDKVAIIMGAKDGKNPLKSIVNSAEVTKEEFLKLIEDISLD